MLVESYQHDVEENNLDEPAPVSERTIEWIFALLKSKQPHQPPTRQRHSKCNNCARQTQRPTGTSNDRQVKQFVNLVTTRTRSVWCFVCCGGRVNLTTLASCLVPCVGQAVSYRGGCCFVRSCATTRPRKSRSMYMYVCMCACAWLRVCVPRVTARDA